MKILIVDDEPAMGKLLSLLLGRLGHESVVAIDPLDGLEMLTPDLDAVITDIQMPHMTGVEFARRVRAVSEDMPIAFCTGSDPLEEVAQEAASIGPVGPKLASVPEVEQLLAGLRRAPTRL